MKESIKRIIGSLLRFPIPKKTTATAKVKKRGYRDYVFILKSDDIGDIPLLTCKTLSYAHYNIQCIEEMYNRLPYWEAWFWKQDNILYIYSDDINKLLTSMHLDLSLFAHEIIFNPKISNHLQVTFVDALPQDQKTEKLLFKGIGCKKI